MKTAPASQYPRNGARRAPEHLGLRVRASRSTPVAWLAAFAFCCSLGGNACAGSAKQTPLPSGPEARAARIDELERAIARDHAALEDLITTDRIEDATALHEDPELRAIAARLGDQKRELERLDRASDTSSDTSSDRAANDPSGIAADIAADAADPAPADPE